MNKDKRLLLIWYALSVHFVWAIVLLFDKSAAQTTPISSSVQFFGHVWLATLVYLVSSMSALIGLFMIRLKFSILFFFPQQFLTLVTAFGAIAATLAGQYSDGVIRPHAFIFADQFPSIIFAFFHTLVIIQAYVWRHQQSQE